MFPVLCMREGDVFIRGSALGTGQSVTEDLILRTAGAVEGCGHALETTRTCVGDRPRSELVTGPEWLRACASPNSPGPSPGVQSALQELGDTHGPGVGDHRPPGTPPGLLRGTQNDLLENVCSRSVLTVSDPPSPSERTRTQGLLFVQEDTHTHTR